MLHLIVVSFVIGQSDYSYSLVSVLLYSFEKPFYVSTIHCKVRASDGSYVYEAINNCSSLATETKRLNRQRAICRTHVVDSHRVTRLHYMTSSVNRIEWAESCAVIGYPSGQDIGIARCGSQGNNVFFPKLNPILTKLVRSRWWILTLFSTPSRSIKKTRQKHLAKIHISWSHAWSIVHIYLFRRLYFSHTDQIS